MKKYDYSFALFIPWQMFVRYLIRTMIRCYIKCRGVSMNLIKAYMPLFEYDPDESQNNMFLPCTDEKSSHGGQRGQMPKLVYL